MIQCMHVCMRALYVMLVMRVMHGMCAMYGMSVFVCVFVCHHPPLKHVFEGGHLWIPGYSDTFQSLTYCQIMYYLGGGGGEDPPLLKEG